MQKNSYDTTTLIVQATGVMQGLISLLLLLLFSIAHARVAFLDIIHSASRSVSAVFDSFKLEIAIASPSFASLFEKCPLQHNDSPCQGAARSLSSKSPLSSSYCCSSLSDVMFWEPSQCISTTCFDHLLLWFNWFDHHLKVVSTLNHVLPCISTTCWSTLPPLIPSLKVVSPLNHLGMDDTCGQNRTVLGNWFVNC